MSRHIIQNRWFDSITFRYPVPSAQRSFAFTAAYLTTVLDVRLYLRVILSPSLKYRFGTRRHLVVESDRVSLLLRIPLAPFLCVSYSHSSGLCIISSAFFFSSGVAPRSLAAFRASGSSRSGGAVLVGRSSLSLYSKSFLFLASSSHKS